jgi:hypothetical protein
VEDLAFDRAALHHDAHVAVEGVDARLQERLDGRRDGDVAPGAAVPDHCEHLLEVQGIPGRRDGDPRT